MSDDTEEREANQFALELLMPTKFMLDDLKDLGISSLFLMGR